MSYPGNEKPALKEDFVGLDKAARNLGVRVTHETGRTCFTPSENHINIDTKTVNPARGYVPVGQLIDEYMHAWNQVRGRGRHLDPEAAKEHQRLGRAAETGGTRGGLTTSENVAFHKLELLNFLASGEPIPGFVWKAGITELHLFATSYAEHYG